MKTYRQFLTELKKQLGTYAAVRPQEADALTLIMKEAKVPNPEENLHATLLYSRKNLPNYTPDPSLEFVAMPNKFEIWPTQSGMNCLVLTLKSPQLQDRHKLLMKEHGATFDYPEYKVHISLSYDVGVFDISVLNIHDLPSVMMLTDEYTEELDLKGR